MLHFISKKFGRKIIWLKNRRILLEKEKVGATMGKLTKGLKKNVYIHIGAPQSIYVHVL